jgi:folate-dependent tRNA-U54 methylase TrmFO/GidA
MLKAETPYNIIQALSESEVARLYQMLGVQSNLKSKQDKKKPLITDAEATEYLLRKLKRY